MDTASEPMGTPFQPIITTYLTVTEVKVHPKSRKVTVRNYRNPDNIVANQTTIKLRRTSPLHTGRTTNLARNKYLAALLLRNEILGCMQQAMDKEGLLRNYRKEFAGSSTKGSRKLFDRLSNYRTSYNKGTLYASQNMPPLYSFPWNKNGYIRHRTTTSIIAGFEYCKRVLRNAKFIDPRFFDEHERAQYEDDPDYHVPSLAEIQRIEAEIGKPLYNSIEFPSGHGKGYYTI